MDLTEMKRAIIYYTDNSLDKTILGTMCKSLLREVDLEIISISHKPIDLGNNIIYMPKNEHPYFSIWKQILLGLRNTDAKIIYMCEHDCLYPVEYFDNKIEEGYNTNFYRLTADGYYYLNKQLLYLSQLVCHKDWLIEQLVKKIKDEKLQIEPTLNIKYKSKKPVLDVRHLSNTSQIKNNPVLRSPVHSETVEYWGDYKQYINLTDGS